MAIKIVAREKKDMRTQEVKWYAQMAKTDAVGLDDVVGEIEKMSTVSSADVKAVLDCLEYVVRTHLQNSQSVRLGDLGSFRPTVSSSGFATKGEVTAAGVTRIRVRFTPSATLTENMDKRRVKLTMAEGEADAAEEVTE